MTLLSKQTKRTHSSTKVVNFTKSSFRKDSHQAARIKLVREIMEVEIKPVFQGLAETRTWIRPMRCFVNDYFYSPFSSTGK